jgi:hypothetical protein
MEQWVGQVVSVQGQRPGRQAAAYQQHMYWYACVGGCMWLAVCCIRVASLALQPGPVPDLHACIVVSGHTGDCGDRPSSSPSSSSSRRRWRLRLLIVLALSTVTTEAEAASFCSLPWCFAAGVGGGGPAWRVDGTWVVGGG